ncbi:YlmH/Sll1252 family protein [Streptobacillus notomytis]|uniref:YlmH/Sll1252 family protein n=1 Tax=Streptobacillus notomytis TaxID=1712031 RepID=UPI000936C195|nr:YlmH/Sll1252 family protein [Streptobacillus notomytis]
MPLIIIMNLNKEEFLKKIGNNEMAIKVFNSLSMALEYQISVSTDIFVTPNIYKKLNNSYDNIYTYMKGYDRRQICFTPNIPEFEYSVIEIKVNNKFKKYTHKDFLGAIMGLNIKREMIGDIFVEDNIGYILISNKVLDFILNNLKSIGKNECVIKISEKNDFSYNFKDIKINISSNRLDNFISDITNLSRNKATQLIEAGLVQIDYEMCKEKNREVKHMNILTIRKYGKYLVYEELEDSKKGKKRWIIKKYE